MENMYLQCISLLGNLLLIVRKVCETKL